MGRVDIMLFCVLPTLLTYNLPELSDDVNVHQTLRSDLKFLTELQEMSFVSIQGCESLNTDYF